MSRALWTARAQAVAVVAGGAFAGVLAKRTLGAVDPFTFAWLQVGFGGLLLSLYTLLWRRERWPRSLPKRVWFHLSLLGVANFAIVRVMFLLSLERLPVNTHIFLVNFVTFATMYLSIVMLRERPSRIQVGGSLVGVFGVWVFFGETPPPEERTGLVLVGIGVLALAFTNNLARRIGHGGRPGAPTDAGAAPALSNTMVSTISLWIGGIPVVIAGLIVDGGVPAVVLELEHAGVILLSATVSIAIGLTVWNHLLRTLRSYEASMLAASSVIFVALFAVPILGDRLGGREMFGVALLVVGIALTQWRKPSVE